MQNIEINGSYSFFPLFPTPVGYYIDLDYLDLKDDFLKMCYDEKNFNTDGRIVSNRGGWQSGLEWFFDDKNKKFNTYIHKMVEKLFYESFDHSGELTFEISNSWININPPGAYNLSHTHPGCDYTGIFYVKLTEDSYILLDNPNNHCHGTTYAMYPEEFKLAFNLNAEIELHPSEGGMIIFPSSLRHSVEENETDEDRVSIAFNINIKNYGRFSKQEKRGKITC